MAQRVKETQLTLGVCGLPKQVTHTHFHFEPGEYDKLRESVEMVACEKCDAPMPKRKAYVFELYNGRTLSREGSYTSYWCPEHFEDADAWLNAFFCDECGRDVLEEDLYDMPEDDYVCIGCATDDILRGAGIDQYIDKTRLKDSFNHWPVDTDSSLDRKSLEDNGWLVIVAKELDIYKKEERVTLRAVLESLDLEGLEYTCSVANYSISNQVTVYTKLPSN